MSTFIYSAFGLYLGQGAIDFDNDTFKVGLLTSSYSPAQNTDTKWSDISGDEASGTGYTAGGVAVSSISWSRSSNVITLDFADVSWENSSITARYGALYDDTHTDDPLIVCLDLGSELTSSSGTFAVQFNASGILTVTVAT